MKFDIYEYFSKICREILILLNSDENNGYFYMKIYVHL